MSMFFADTTDQITLGVQASNQAEVTQFSSTTNEVFMRLYTNNNKPTDNLLTGVVIGSSNYDKSGGLNNLYLGMITDTSNIQKSFLIQKDRVGISTSSPNALFQVYGSNVYSNWTNLARFEVVKPGASVLPAFVIDSNGNIGMGTEVVSGNAVTIKGTLQVDSLQIGPAGSGGSPSLITSQGLQPPTGITNLQFNNASMSNINNIIIGNSLYASNTIYANNYAPFNPANTIYYSGANLSNISVIYPSQIQFTNLGTAGSPALTFQSNANTGLFEPATNNIAISTAGNEALRVNSVGNVGIGTQNPQYALDVTGTINTPYLIGSNIIQTFTNIANFTFVNGATASVNPIPATGQVTMNIKMNGNSTGYSFTLTFVNTATMTRTTTGTLTIQSGSTYTYVATFTAGTYNTNISIQTPGTGAGSSAITNNIVTFTVPAIDNVGAPTMTVSTTYPPSYSTNHLIYISGIPYYSNNTQITFSGNPNSSLNFTNLYNIVDPTSGNLSKPVFQINGTNTSYSDAFNNIFTTSTNTNYSPIYTTLNILQTPPYSKINITGIVYNLNYNINGIPNYGAAVTLVSGIAYLNPSDITTINENTMNVASFANMSINSVTRLTNADNTNAANPALANIAAFTNQPTTMNNNDAFYTPYSNGGQLGKICLLSGISSTLGPNAPTLPSFTGTHNFFTIKIDASAVLNSFVLNFNSSATIGILNVYVNWESITPWTWYNAKTVYTNTGGCASATYSKPQIGDRYPITLPSGLALTQKTVIYINIQLDTNQSSSIDLSTFSITNT